MANGWNSLITNGSWDCEAIREWEDVAGDARRNKNDAHMGRIFCIMVEQWPELPSNDERKKL